MISQIGEADVGVLEAPGDEFADGFAAELRAEDDDEGFFGCDGLGEVRSAGFKEGGKLGVVAVGNKLREPGLAIELDGSGVGDVEPGLVEPDGGAARGPPWGPTPVRISRLKSCAAA